MAKRAWMYSICRQNWHYRYKYFWWIWLVSYLNDLIHYRVKTALQQFTWWTRKCGLWVWENMGYRWIVMGRQKFSNCDHKRKMLSLCTENQNNGGLFFLNFNEIKKTDLISLCHWTNTSNKDCALHYIVDLLLGEMKVKN